MTDEAGEAGSAPPKAVVVRGGTHPPRGRVVPLAVLVALLAVAVTAKMRASPKAPSAAMAEPATLASAAAAEPDAASPPPTGLGAAPATTPGKTADHATRMLHADAHHTHRAHGKVPRAPNVTWTYKTGGAVAAQITTSPDEQTLYVASLDGTLTALTREGAKKWSLSLGDRIYATPCVADDGTLYVGSDAKKFAAVAPDGRVKWRLDTDGDADTGAVLAKDGSVIFAAGKAVYAVRSGGDVAWRYRTKKKVFTAPAIADDGTVVFGAHDDRAYALTPNGALLWSTDLGGDVDGSPAIGDDGSIFVGTDAGEVVRLTPKGDVVWRAKVGGYVRGALSLARNGDVLAGVFGPSPRAVRIAAEDGAVRGDLPITGTGAKDFGVHGGALEDDEGALVFGGQDDAVYALEPSGAIRWRLATTGDVDGPVTLLADGSLAFVADDGEGGKVYLLAP